MVPFCCAWPSSAARTSAIRSYASAGSACRRMRAGWVRLRRVYRVTKWGTFGLLLKQSRGRCSITTSLANGRNTYCGSADLDDSFGQRRNVVKIFRVQYAVLG
eukprot:1753506-Pyramimonas_sp.AAC.1